MISYDECDTPCKAPSSYLWHGSTMTTSSQSEVKKEKKKKKKTFSECFKPGLLYFLEFRIPFSIDFPNENVVTVFSNHKPRNKVNTKPQEVIEKPKGLTLPGVIGNLPPKPKKNSAMAMLDGHLPLQKGGRSFGLFVIRGGQQKFIVYHQQLYNLYKSRKFKS